MSNRVFFSHGKDSKPWGIKIRAFADVAVNLGFETFSPDYQGMDDPEKRVQHLLDSVQPDSGKLVLVGSSLGAYVSIKASASLRPHGLFLVAPAVYLPQLACDEAVPDSPLVELVHGWQDEVVPAENALRFASRHRTTLHMFNGDHRLIEQLPAIQSLFEGFLQRILENE